jgi:hypothetical protein
VEGVRDKIPERLDNGARCELILAIPGLSNRADSIPLIFLVDTGAAVAIVCWSKSGSRQYFIHGAVYTWGTYGEQQKREEEEMLVVVEGKGGFRPPREGISAQSMTVDTW